MKFSRLWPSVPWVFEDSTSPLSAFLPHLNSRLIPTHGSGDRHAFTNVEDRAVLSLYGIASGRGHFQPHDHAVRQLQKAWPGIFKWMVHLFNKWLGFSVSETPRVVGDMSANIVSATLRAFSEVPSLNQLVTTTPGCIELATQIFIKTPSNGSFFSVSMAGLMGLLSKTTLSPRTFFERMISVDGCNASTITDLVMSRIHIATLRDDLNDSNLVDLLDILNCLSSIPLISLALLERKAVSEVSLVAYRLSCLVGSGHGVEYVHPTLLCLSYLAENLESGDGVTSICQSIKHGLLAAWAVCSGAFNDKPLPGNIRGGPIIKIVSDIIPRYLTYRSVIEQTLEFFQKWNFRVKGGRLQIPWDRFVELFKERHTLMLGIPLIKSGCSNPVCVFPPLVIRHVF